MSQVSGLVSGAKQAPRRSGWSPVIFHMGNPELKGIFVGGENHRTIHGGFSQQFPDFMAGKARKSYTWQVGKPHFDPSKYTMGGLTCHGRSNAVIRIYGRIQKRLCPKNDGRPNV